MPVSGPSRGMQTAEASASVVEHGSIHAQLRQATAAHHQRLDRGLGYVLSDRCSVDRYVDLLAALFGFYVPLEDHLSVWAARVGALPLIRRAGLLERDLGVFGRGHDQIATNAEMPTLTSVDHVAGAIYVVEGACLGGQVIARAAMQRLGIGPQNGARFFTGDGAHTGARWKQVLAWLDHRDRDRFVRNEIVEGACRTFAALSQWLSAREVLDE